MKSKNEIADKFKKDKKITIEGLSLQYQNTRDCQSFYAGDFMDFWIGASSTDNFGVKKRAMVQINKCKPFVNAIKGFMAQNRRSVNYSARIQGNKIQEVYSKYANSLKDYVRKRTYADQKETQMDGDTLICGYSAIETALSYTNGHSTTDPNGQIKMGRLDPEQVGWDPFAKATNLLDARWAYYYEVYDIEDALSLFQDSDEDDFETADDEDLSGGQAGYHFYARGGRYNKIKETTVDWSDEKAEKVKVYFYQWYEFETFYRMENPLLPGAKGEPPLIQDPRLAALMMQRLEIVTQEFPQADDMFAFDPRAVILNFDEDIKKELLKIFGKDIADSIHEYRRKCYYSAVISGKHVFSAYKNISQQGFTIKFKTGDYDSKNKLWTGIINCMKEPTLYYNKGLTELMFIIGANSKGGVYVEEDAVDDLQLFEQQYSKTDAVIEVAAGALTGPGGPKIQPKKQPQGVTGYESIVTQMNADIPDSVGVDRTFLGSSENKQETGVLNRQRIKQVVSTLACYFDSITLYQLEWSLMNLDLMRVYAQNNDGELFNVKGENGRDFLMQIASDKFAPEYDVDTQEAPQSPEEKQEYATILMGIAEKLLAAGLQQQATAIYAIAVKYLALDTDDRDAVVKLLAPAPGEVSPQQVQQLQSQLKMLTGQATKVALDEKASKSAANYARARLDNARITEVGSKVTKNKADAFHQVHEAILDETVARHDASHPEL